MAGPLFDQMFPPEPPADTHDQRSIGFRMNDPFSSPQERAEAWQELQVARNRGPNQRGWMPPPAAPPAARPPPNFQQQQRQQQWRGGRQNAGFGGQPLVQRQAAGMPQAGQPAQNNGMQALMAMLPMLQQAQQARSAGGNPILSMLGGAGGAGGGGMFGGSHSGSPMDQSAMNFNDVRAKYLSGARF